MYKIIKLYCLSKNRCIFFKWDVDFDFLLYLIHLYFLVLVIDAVSADCKRCYEEKSCCCKISFQRGGFQINTRRVRVKGKHWKSFSFTFHYIFRFFWRENKQTWPLKSLTHFCVLSSTLNGYINCCSLTEMN